MQTVKRLYEYFQPRSYHLELSLERVERVFQGKVTIAGQKMHDNQPICLHAKDLNVTSVVVDDTSVAFTHRADELTITSSFPAGEYAITVMFDGAITDPMHGLYPCYFEHDEEKKELLITQFESHHAREVFPCIDEPEAKATFDLILITEPNVTVLSNMPEIEGGRKEEEGRKATTFQTTPRMSTYLLAFVVGELHKKSSKTKSGVEVNVWATPAQPSESLDFALDIATRAIDFYDEYFGTPYPLPKSDHVAVPDFSAGAMENWGLITYREAYLLAEPRHTSVSSKQHIAAVIAHELSHQWFGNLVTMRWWNDLWLNESFARIMEYIAVDALEPSWNIWQEFSTNAVISALRRDAIDGVQSVQTKVRHPDEINSLFDPAIVYAKGARLIRMMQNYVGDKAFQTGLKDYFDNFAYKNTVADDLWNSMTKTGGKDVASLMNQWVSQPGYPVVEVGDNALTQTQFFVGPHQPSAQTWAIPLGAPDDNLPKLFTERRLPLKTGAEVRFNVGDTAHFITRYSKDQVKNIITSIADGSLTTVERLRLLNEQTLLARGGYTTSSEIIPFIKSFADEAEEAVWSIIVIALGELKLFVEDDSEAEDRLRKMSGKIARKQFERLGWKTIPGEPENDTKLRSTILGVMIYSRDDKVLEKAEAIFRSSELEDLDPELRALVTSVVIRENPDDDKTFNELIEVYKKTSSPDLKIDLTLGVTSTKDAEKIRRLLGLITDKDVVRPQDVRRWLTSLMSRRESRNLAWQWITNEWSWIEKTFGSDKNYDAFPNVAGKFLTTRQQLAQFKAFFDSKKSIPGLTRAIELGAIEIEGRVELIERDRAAVITKLKRES